MQMDRQATLELHANYLNVFMQVTLVYVNKGEVRDNPNKLRILFAYFYGPADHYGLKMGLNRKDILTNLIPCLIKHTGFAQDEMEVAVQLFYGWDDDERKKVMDKGCVALASVVNIGERQDQINWDNAENQRVLMTVCQELSQLLEG